MPTLNVGAIAAARDWLRSARDWDCQAFEAWDRAWDRKLYAHFFISLYFQINFGLICRQPQVNCIFNIHILKFRNTCVCISFCQNLPFYFTLEKLRYFYKSFEHVSSLSIDRYEQKTKQSGQLKGLLAPIGALVVAPFPLFHITSSRSSKSYYKLLTLLQYLEHFCLYI